MCLLLTGFEYPLTMTGDLVRGGFSLKGRLYPS